nr:MAG TPA: hypothetical protein [Caudoviricetes sp.]
MEKILLSMSFTEEEAKAIKKAFAQVSTYPPLKINVSGARENILTDGEEKRQTVKSNDEFMEYLERNPEAIKEDFRRRTTIQCLEEYEKELARRRNRYKGYTKEFNILEERRKEIIKISKFLEEEMRISDVRKIFLGIEV